MRLLFVGDFGVGRSSGYAVILKHVCSGLARRGHQVTLLGDKWDRSEHDFPFQVIMTDHTWIPMQVLRLHQALKFDHVILAMDVPKIVQTLEQMILQKLEWPSPSGLFPIEATPLVGPWAAGLRILDRRFVISQFGKDELDRWELDSTWLPMTAELPEASRTRKDALERLAELVRLGNPDLLQDSMKIALTVADNQERKDLPVIAQALNRRRTYHGQKIVWCLITPVNAPYGWHLPGLLDRLGVADQTVVLEHLSEEDVRAAYSAADCFVLASQAEGACLPLYEAMAHGLTCVAPLNTAITEAITNGRGIGVPISWESIHPWGNVTRAHVGADDLAKGIGLAIEDPTPPELLREFISSRPWSLAVDKIEEALQADG